jgi:hypothetical membrane protein
MRWLGLGGMIGPAVFATMVVVCAAWRPGYSHTAQFISELGATGTPGAAWMNGLGFLPAGAGIAMLGIALARHFRGDRLALVGAGLVAGFGVALLTAGVVPCEAGCPQAEPTLHDGSSVVGFVAAIVGFAIFGLVFRRHEGWRRLAWPSAAASAVGLVLLVGLARSIESREWTGLWQRLLVATLFLWCAVVGWRTLRAGGRAQPPTGTAPADEMAAAEGEGTR